VRTSVDGDDLVIIGAPLYSGRWNRHVTGSCDGTVENSPGRQ
jgi:menaquinone-dependent protoporphyrinogen IX oxidase